MLYLALYIRFGSPTAPDNEGSTPVGGIIGIVFIYLYAFGWSFGHSVACYVVAAEIFPTRIRSFCMRLVPCSPFSLRGQYLLSTNSLCFFVNWIVDYAITRATPAMITGMGYGTFLLYSILTYTGVIFIYFVLPEMKGRSIESMDDLFQRPLWTMYKHAYPTEEEKVRSDVQAARRMEKSDSAECQGKNSTSLRVEVA